MLERINSSLFDWLTCRNDTILDLLNIRQRTAIILANKNRLKQHAIGWCPAEQVPCRPKANHMAVMFLWYKARNSGLTSRKKSSI